MEFIDEDIVKLSLAILLGGLVGAEREYRDKAAGLRTMMLICVGSCLFTVFSIRIAGQGDPSRIAASIVTGIGFLGAGAILRANGQVVGLTTASTVWVTAALGMGIGFGNYAFVTTAAVAVLMVLRLVPFVEKWIGANRQRRRYEIRTEIDHGKLLHIENALRTAGLTVQASNQHKVDTGEMLSIWDTIGPPSNHDRFTRLMLEDPTVKELRS